MEEDSKLNISICFSLAAIYLIFSYQFANNKGFIPIISWLPEIIYDWLIIIGFLGGFGGLSFLISKIVLRLSESFFALLLGIFGFHGLWFWFLFSLNK